MGKTKRIKDRKTKGKRKTKGYRKTRRRLKQMGGGENISIDEITKDITKLSKENFAAKYDNTLDTIFAKKYKYDKCWRMYQDVRILQELFKNRNGKTKDYKVNLYNVVMKIRSFAEQCYNLIVNYPYHDPYAILNILTTNRNLKVFFLTLETELGLTEKVNVEEVKKVIAENQGDELVVAENTINQPDDATGVGEQKVEEENTDEE
jgi:hypothetical protein